MTESKQAEVFKQLQEAFQTAQGQMAQLRSAVEHTAELARMKSQGDFLQREKERALEALGEGVLRLVQKGKLELPASLAPLLQAVQEAERQAAAHASSITEILKEGEEAVARLKKAEAATRGAGAAPKKSEAAAKNVLASRPKRP